MACDAVRVTVGTSATRLDISTMVTSGVSVLVRNRGAVAAYLGGAAVTTAAGYQLDAGEAATVDARVYQLGLWGVVASGTAECHVLQVGE